MKPLDDVGAWGIGVDFKVEWGDRSVWTGSFETIGKWGRAKRLRGGGYKFTQDEGQHSYLTHSPARMAASPRASFPIPGDEVALEVDIHIDGPAVSLWLVEFEGSAQVGRHSWRLDKSRKAIRWKPNPACDSVRLALRVAGPGNVGRPRIRIVDAADDQAMQLWRALNGPVEGLTLASDLSRRLAAASVEPLTRWGPTPRMFVCPIGGSFSAEGLNELRDMSVDPSSLGIDTEVSEETLPATIRGALENGFYEASCPRSGRRLRSINTFLVSQPVGRPYVIVRFDGGEEPFYIVYCPYKSSRIGIYFPIREKIFATGNIVSVIHYFRTWCIYFLSEVIAYLKSEKRKLCIPVNATTHWGHVFFNELPGLREAEEEGLLKNVEIWLDHGLAFGDMGRVSAGGDGRVVSRHDRISVFLHALQEKAFIVRPGVTRHVVDARVARLIRRFCEDEAARTDYGAEVRDQLVGRWPVLWLELRCGKHQRWLDQEREIVDLLATLKPRYPDLAVVLSGWSMMQSFGPQDAANIHQELSLAGRLAAALPDVPFMPIMGEQTWRKIVWALNSHTFAVAEGSGVSFPAAIAGLDGLLLTRKDYFNARNVGKQLEAVPYWDAISPYIYLVDAGAGSDSGEEDPRSFRCNGKQLANDLDARVLSRLVSMRSDKQSGTRKSEGT